MEVLGNQVAGFFHEAVDPFFIDRDALPVLEIAPDAPVIPERVIDLELFDLLEQRVVTSNNGLRFLPFHKSSSSFFLIQP